MRTYFLHLELHQTTIFGNTASISTITPTTADPRTFNVSGSITTTTNADSVTSEAIETNPMTANPGTSESIEAIALYTASI